MEAKNYIPVSAIRLQEWSHKLKSIQVSVSSIFKVLSKNAPDDPMVKQAHDNLVNEILEIKAQVEGHFHE